MKKLFITILLGITFISFYGRFTNEANAAMVNYEKWKKVLNTYVNDNGRVNYDGLKANRAVLDDFIASQIENIDISSLSKNEQKAFWINAYNALTMRLIVDHYPMRFGGIRSINWGRPWSIKIKVAGKELSLGEIEHEILRKWDPIDPRVHFAMNCASIGCPKLPNRHFNPEKLDEQLDHEARRFMNDPEKVKLDRSENTLYYSEIFKWFEQDFLAQSPDIKSYISRYINDKKYIESDNIKLKTFKYDWGLNKQ